MSDANPFDFGKFIPGFDFLQKLTASGQGAAAPGPALHNWVAPTVSVDEIDKRIKELKAVLFWLDQNATALKATIQALEVQKMTLSALAGMNLSLAEVTKAFTIPTAEVPATPAAAPVVPEAAQGWPFGPAPAAEPPADATPPVEETAAEPEPPAAPPRPARKRAPRQAAAPDAAPAAGLADPMQWWGALTQQFQQIAAKALRDAARSATPEGAGEAPASGDAAQADAAPPRRSPAKKAAAKKPAAKKAPARAAKKPAARGAKAAKTAKKSAARAPASSKPAAKSEAGWPLPPPFKFGR